MECFSFHDLDEALKMINAACRAYPPHLQRIARQAIRLLSFESAPVVFQRHGDGWLTPAGVVYEPRRGLLALHCGWSAIRDGSAVLYARKGGLTVPASAKAIRQSLQGPCARWARDVAQSDELAHAFAHSFSIKSGRLVFGGNRLRFNTGIPITGLS